MSSLKQFIREIHQRSLWQVLAIYLVGAAVAYQLIEALVSGLGLPEWFPPFAILLFIVGLPIVLATAFIQEGGPLKGHADPTLIPESSDPKVSRPAATGARRLFSWRNAISGGVVALALWGVIATGWIVLHGGAADSPTVDRKSVAVLPFINMSADPDNEYFSDGITETIIAHLSKIADLKVISRTSIMQYEQTEKNLRQIADELGVATILEGSVQRAEDRVQITAQLIDAQRDEHLWAEVYERELADIFAVQADVAERIARALAAELTPEAQARIERRPTDDMEAYDAYLRGEGYAGRGFGEEDARLAIQMYERALKLDPGFAVAWAALAERQARLYWFHYDRSDAPLTAARRAIDRALALDPELPEAYLARGLYHYWGHLDYDRALRDLERARVGLPGDARVVTAMGSVRRRQGRFDLAVDLFRKAVELDPRSQETLENLAATLELRREYDEALRLLDRLITLAPDHGNVLITKARVLARGLGELEGAWETLEPAFKLPARGEYSAAYYGVLVQLYAREYSKALEILEAGEEEEFQTQFYYLPKPLVRARILDFMDRSAPARVSYDSARVVLERKLAEFPEDPRLHSALGLALAGLGRSAEAIRSSERAVELLPMAREAWRGGNFVIDAARILTRVGETEAAIDRLERMLSVPSELTPTGLRLDPTWDPLRDHPRFQALLERYE
jgi:TolB-like protein/Flp pilus assembly protein TadD